jgi:hypothetical protein
VTADFLAVLDACVLVPAPLRDTLLRLAEPPRLYVPRWSEEIITETVRNLEDRIGLSTVKTDYLVGQLRKHFGDSWIARYEPLAAAVKCGAQVIVTYNKRDFPVAATEPWGIEIQGPSMFLKYQYDLNPPVVVDKLHAQARNLGRTLPEQLTVLRNAASAFVDVICQDLGIEVTT